MTRRQLRGYQDKALRGLQSAQDSAVDGMRNLYTTASNYPKTTAAFVLGAAVAGTIIWALQRYGYRKIKQQLLRGVRRQPARSRARREAVTQ
jgi:hypothetical protein